VIAFAPPAVEPPRREDLLGIVSGIEEDEDDRPRADPSRGLLALADAMGRYVSGGDLEAGAGPVCDDFPGVAATFDRHLREQRGCMDRMHRIADEVRESDDRPGVRRLMEQARRLVEDLCRIQQLKEARLRILR
jgi:hypothetical protein